ncbi:uncharacterized protein LOC128152655 isoform X2 [Harpia harpyja]|uniref:uncharacterized protein LOC128152655 isoform X2 n=1 Tax=Harpia harpyja TaxID=202280 RepID=UPI0022B180F1|nr:uncharacterized protein LOC128152655 isoform X2 [Harpia harpyja]
MRGGTAATILMASKGRAGETLIPCTASSPRGLGRIFIEPKQAASSSRELTPRRRGSNCPSRVQEGSVRGASPGSPWAGSVAHRCRGGGSSCAPGAGGSSRSPGRCSGGCGGSGGWCGTCCSATRAAGTAPSRSPRRVGARGQPGSAACEYVSPRCPWRLSARCGAAVESGKRQPGERGGGGGRGLHFCAGAWAGRAVAERQRCGDAMLERLEALEADVRFLCTELGAEKLLWSSRFLELLREQQGLRQRERPRRWDSGDSPELLGEAEDQSASGSEGESLAGRRWMEPRWQPAPCPGSLLGPAASRQAENVSKGVSGVLVRREGATCPSLPRHCRTQGRTAQSWLCSHVLVCASILQCQPGPAPSCPILPSPAHSAELQPVPRSRNQPGGSSGQAAVSWAAQGRSQSPLARGHPWD